MARLNVKVAPVYTHEGGVAQAVSPLLELRRSVLTCLLWEDTFYENGSDLAKRIAGLVGRCKPEEVAALAIEARDKMQLRHVPLFLVRELARHNGNGTLVAATLAHVIQRPDELGEYVAMCLPKKEISAGSKRGLAAAFRKFDEYRLAKYNRDGKVKLRDVLFLCHAKPRDEEQAALWKRLIDGTLQTPDTWEVELSAGKDKKETFERLMREGKLGGLAVLRNLRNMQQAKVDDALIRERLSHGIKRALPFRFVTAARYAPQLEDALEGAMLAGIADLDALPGTTGLLVDVSGSMDAQLSTKGETTRMDAACGLAILLREKAHGFGCATFSNGLAVVPPRRGFALRDAIQKSQTHGGTYLAQALTAIKAAGQAFDRFIVITDEQSHDGSISAWLKNAYVVNVGTYKHGVSYGNGWQHIDGWSERIVDWIAANEREAES